MLCQANAVLSIKDIYTKDQLLYAQFSNKVYVLEFYIDPISGLHVETCYNDWNNPLAFDTQYDILF